MMMQRLLLLLVLPSAIAGLAVWVRARGVKVQWIVGAVVSALLTGMSFRSWRPDLPMAPYFFFGIVPVVAAFLIASPRSLKWPVAFLMALVSCYVTAYFGIVFSFMMGMRE